MLHKAGSLLNTEEKQQAITLDLLTPSSLMYRQYSIAQFTPWHLFTAYQGKRRPQKGKIWKAGNMVCIAQQILD